MQVRLNAWNQPFYDAIAAPRPRRLHPPARLFFASSPPSCSCSTSRQTGCNQLIRVKLREPRPRDLIGNWMTAKRAARISRAGEIGVNPDQRIQADTQTPDRAHRPTSASAWCSPRSCWRASSACSGSSRAGSSSRSMATTWRSPATWSGRRCSTRSPARWSPGGSAARWCGSAPSATRARPSSAPRLVQASERAEGIALSDGEADARHGLEASLATLIAALRRIAFARVAADLGDRRLRLGRAGLPDHRRGARLFRRPAQLRRADDGGRRLQPGAASLRWFVDNTGAIADWRATLLRVMNFRAALSISTRSRPAPA